jgi:hypothetical protein
LAQDLRALLRLAACREEEPTAAILDSRTLRSTPESGARAGYDGAKRKRRSKVHLAVDTLGRVLAPHVTPADVGDREAVARLAADIQDATGDSVELAFVDQGYTGEAAAKLPPRKVSACMSSNCQRPSEALSCCPDGGSSSDHLPGQLGVVGWSRTTSDSPKHLPESTSSLSSDTCSSTQQR